MLVLGRKRGEKIIIYHNDEKIVVEVVDGRHVRLGITASKDVTIVREEIDINNK